MDLPRGAPPISGERSFRPNPDNTQCTLYSLLVPFYSTVCFRSPLSKRERAFLVPSRRHAPGRKNLGFRTPIRGGCRGFPRKFLARIAQNLILSASTFAFLETDVGTPAVGTGPGRRNLVDPGGPSGPPHFLKEPTECGTPHFFSGRCAAHKNKYLL